MREYIELKYGDIYNEYCLFFKSLNEKHPSSKDLTKTRSYKNWKKEQLKNEQSDSGDQSETTPNQPEPEATPKQTEPEATPYQIEPEATTNHTDPTEPAVVAVPFQETSPIVNVDNIINQLMIEFEQDETIRNLLNENNDNQLVHPSYEDEDEGIGLNVQTELEVIIEPFDYNLEVEEFEEYNLEGF